MANPIPKWVMIRYSKLWKRFNEEPASYEDIEKVLKDIWSENLIYSIDPFTLTEAILKAKEGCMLARG